MSSRNRGIKKPSLRDLSRKIPSNEDITAKLESLNTGDPTTAAISGAVIVEHELEGLLRGHFPRDDDNTWLLLTEDSGPLRSFHAKIVLAYAFHILDDASLHNINLIRNIRNAFAHSKFQLNFDNEVIVKNLRSARTPNRAAKRLSSALDYVRSTDDPRRAFSVLCDYTAAELVKRNNRRLQRKSRRMDARLTKIKAEIATRSAMNPQPMGLLEFLLNQAPSSPDHQSDDPTDEALPPSSSSSPE